MKQVIQNYSDGELTLMEVPVPKCGRKSILVQTHISLISTGTERSVIELGKKSLFGKARARPDLVKRVIEKAKKEGVIKTFKEAMGRLDTPTPLGYSCAGVTIEVGTEALDFAPGDRVACIGQGFASHAEFVSVPMNMVCRIPDNVTDEEASFGMLGVIAMHGVRSANLTFGSSVVVIGLGLLGLITVQLLKAYGCQVIATDLSTNKVELAKELGADIATSDLAELKNSVNGMTDGFGVDAVIITAATKSSEPVNLAIELCRFQGKMVLVGVADIHPDRNELWNKEIEIVVSKAAGPGSLDPLYELQGIDIPIGYARWTQNRNLKEFLRLISEKQIDVEKLITHRKLLKDAIETYKGILDGGLKDPIGVTLEYPREQKIERTITSNTSRINLKKDAIIVDVLGAGLFGKTVLLPVLEKTPCVNLGILATSSGVSANHSGKKFNFETISTDSEIVFENSTADSIFALTPHSQHSATVLRAIENGKNLFIEKPLCIEPSQLDEISDALANCENRPIIMVGHNRRFSPHAVKIKSWLETRLDPLVINIVINAGFVPVDHWVHSEDEGRSRIVGEMSHFIDLMQFFTGEKPARVYAERIAGNNKSSINNDNVTITVKFSGGSVGSLTYSASGNRSHFREQYEIYWEGNIVRSVDFRKTKLFSSDGEKKFNTSGQEIGYAEEIYSFCEASKGNSQNIVSTDEMLTTMKTIFAIEEALATGSPSTIV